MATQKITRRILTGFFNAGATLSVGILAFAGMFVITASWFWCTAAFILAAGYESQINGEGIALGLKRFFDPDYTSLQILKSHADKDKDFPLRKDYLALKASLATLKARISALRKNQPSWLEKLRLFFLNTPEAARIRQQIKDREEEIRTLKDKKRILNRQMRESLLSLLESDESPLKKDHPERYAGIQREITVRKRWLKLGWLIALATGVSSGFATLGSMGSAIAVFPILAAVPPVGLIILSVIAGAGYIFLIYQTLSDMMHDDTGVWKNLFKRHNDRQGKPENNLAYGLRLAGTIIAIGLGIFATFATAGTWWYAMKDGAAIARIATVATNILSYITLPFMAIGMLVFNTQNSADSIAKIAKTNFRNAFDTARDDFKATGGNPFLVAERIIDYLEKPFLFILHILSIGVMSDRVYGVPPVACTLLGGASEGIVDFSYLPHENEHHAHAQSSPTSPHHHDCEGAHSPGEHSPHDHSDHEHDAAHGHQHNHGESLALKMLFLPFTIVKATLKSIGVLWDLGISLAKHHLISKANPAPSLSASFEKIFPSNRQKAEEPAVKEATLSEDWKKLPVERACSHIIRRLGESAPAKAEAARQIRNELKNAAPLDEVRVREAATPLAVNRSHFWHKPVTRSQGDMDEALRLYRAAAPSA